MLRQTLRTEAVNRLVDVCFQQYPDGLVSNVHKGQVPAQAQSVARYVAQYVVSPPISVRRIDRYDGKRVTYHDRSHRTGRTEHETVPVDTFIVEGNQSCEIGPHLPTDYVVVHTRIE
jgi:putative transposase